MSFPRRKTSRPFFVCFWITQFAYGSSKSTTSISSPPDDPAAQTKLLNFVHKQLKLKEAIMA